MKQRKELEDNREIMVHESGKPQLAVNDKIEETTHKSLYFA